MLAKKLSDLALKLIDRRVIIENIITDFGIDHELPQGMVWIGDGIAPEIDELFHILLEWHAS